MLVEFLYILVMLDFTLQVMEKLVTLKCDYSIKYLAICTHVAGRCSYSS